MYLEKACGFFWIDLNSFWPRIQVLTVLNLAEFMGRIFMVNVNHPRFGRYEEAG